MELAHPVFQLAYQGDATQLNNLFLEDPQLVNRPDYDGNMPLHLAALSGSVSCVQVCLEALERRGEDLDMQTEIQRKNFSNRDAACCAVIAGSVECLELLFQAGARTDYRFATEIPILVEALNGSNVQITRLVLESIEADFSATRRDQYWFTALKRDLRISMEYFKLLKAYAVPYGIGDFEELCLRLIELKPATTGLEDFLLYLSTDAVDRWSRYREEVVEGLRRITSYFLRKLVPHRQTLDSIHRLQQLGVLEPPRSVRAWLRVLNEWGIPFAQIDDPAIQDRLLSNLCTSVHPVPLIHDPSLLPLVLYFATLALKFPHPGWLSSWSELCVRAGYMECSLATLFEVHTVRHSRSAADFFWCEVFPLAVLRAIAVLESEQGVSFSSINEELKQLVDHILSHCPAMRPDQNVNRDNLLFKVLSSFSASNNAPGHPLFISFVSSYILPWIPKQLTLSARPHGLITSTVHVLSHRTLLETVLDYSPTMTLYLVRNLSDWPHRSQSHLDALADCLVLAYVETEGRFVLPDQLVRLLPVQLADSTDPVSSTASSVTAWFQNWFTRFRAKPFSLRSLAKIQIRLSIRRSLQTSEGEAQKPLSFGSRQLSIPPALQTFINSFDLA